MESERDRIALTKGPHVTVTSLLNGIGGGARRLVRRVLPGPSKHPKGDRMKWYFATNEAGSAGEGGLHAKIAVLSARKNTRLRPHLITTGFRNGFTDWMEQHGVTLIDAAMPLTPTIEAADARGDYSRAYLGHWLRCEIPLLEQEDPFVLYTDVDVVFLRPVRLGSHRPAVFACAPEFRIGDFNYVNTGVMVMNVERLRETAPAFFAYAAAEIGGLRGSAHYHDQIAYNRFYLNQWSPLDLHYNWKPYWHGIADPNILHFHGAKLGGIRGVLHGQADYDNHWWRSIASLVASYREGYVDAIRATLAAIADGDLEERAWIEQIARDLESAPPPVPAEAIDLSFMNHRMFDVGRS